jgi:primosomal protein N' (replication factor Y) (superfamily II helicase)
VGEAMFCEVIIDIKHTNVNRYFDYLVPEHLIPFLERGMRVVVPFNEQKRLGFVMRIKEESQFATKSILDILDVLPTISEASFKLLDQLENEVIAPYAALIETVIPNEFMMNYHKQIRIINQTLVFDHMKPYFNRNGVWHIKGTDYHHKNDVKKMIEIGAVTIETIAKGKAKPKTKKTYKLSTNHTYALTKRQLIAIDQMKMDAIYDDNDLEAFGLSASMVSTLTKHGVLKKSNEIVIRDVFHVFDLKPKEVTLTKKQNEIYQALIQHKAPQTYLLKGITGSGKTELYIQWIKHFLDQGKKAILLVPEIVLIGMMAQRLKSSFPDQVVIYHSALSTGERYDAIMQLAAGQARILLGTRSALFVPVEDLGIIILDEEQDNAYIQKEGVQYDARKFAEILAKHHQAHLVLGSATPSLVSMYQAQQNKYRLLELNERPFATPMPKISYVDMKDELKSGNTSMFSKKLINGIKERLSRKEQVLILHNRKGYAPFVLCRSCGHVPSCPHCEISLTYYQEKNELKCHYCGYQASYNKVCNVCTSETIKPVGAGTELVVQSLKKQFPDANILRMDADVTTTKGSHEHIWHTFANRDADILIGTQMISKGLDFPKVTLVGILMADQLLKIPSYFASEQTYMLLAQMSGRSGRLIQGESIIQGYNTEHFAIQSVAKDYDYFYQKAINDRKLASYEPFVSTSQILFEGHGYLETYQVAFQFRKNLMPIITKVLGPAPAILRKIKDKYRFTITLKYDQLDISKIKDLINHYQTKHIRITYIPMLEH